MTSLHNGHILRDPLPGEHVPTIDDRDDLCLDGWSPLALRVRTQALREVGVAAGIFARVGVSNHTRRGHEYPAWRALVWARMREIQIPGIGCLSYPEIGAVTGTNHSTIVTAVRRFQEAQMSAKEAMQ